MVHKTHLSDQINGLLNTIATQDSQNVMDWSIRCISSGKSLFESIALSQPKKIGNSHQSTVICNNVLLNILIMYKCVTLSCFLDKLNFGSLRTYSNCCGALTFRVYPHRTAAAVAALPLALLLGNGE